MDERNVHRGDQGGSASGPGSPVGIPVLEVSGLTKRFPGVLANDHISLKLHKGEVLGLLGENGAGKSTLMNMIYGLYQPDEGEIRVNGKPVTIHGPNDAISRGIGMVHQHFQLVPVLSVTDNVMLGTESMRGRIFLNRGAARKRILDIAAQYGLEVDPDALVQDLPVGVQQRVEIIKALYRRADILILDEPTAVLTPQEAEGLFGIMRTLIDRGTSIIFISHKLKEVLEICDRVQVLRLGKVVGEADPKTSTEHSLAELMVGRDVVLQVEKSPAHPKDHVLDVNSLVVTDDRGLTAVKSLNLQVRAGEILGIAGVQGNGQTELVEAITGLRKPVSGKVLIDGKDVTGKPPRDITEAGTGHVPEDRQKNGMVMSFAVRDNMVLQTYYELPFSKSILRDEKAIDANAEHLVKQYDVRTPGIYTPIGKLSGGNQQKVIVAREFSRPLRLLIAAQPTRGLDVGSIEYIHKQIIAMRDQGAAVLLVSAELDEILSLSDTVAVMYAGNIIATLPIDKADRNTVGLLMAGVVPDHAREFATPMTKEVSHG
ncbi:MAG: ABC transporter ATP-binding protein [Pleurocapsa minor GSE-CHR-MK-17-07R]|jgi:simple sugar transport system ATP-binding protein|nr:ABC transporter ATP-binding protein [Pleurocapsa minor GSE-CHR-MK 17-07R]